MIYFLAGKSEGWFVIGASLFSSNIGSEIILGVSGAGARAEMPMANFEMLACFILILLGWVFVPFYLRTGVYTMPEFLEKRYSKACRNYLSVVSILAYVITKISLIIFSGALIFESMGVPFWTGAIITVLVTGLYTVLGGLKAMIYTDMVQAFILIAGCAAVTYFALSELGGWDEMISTIQMLLPDLSLFLILMHGMAAQTIRPAKTEDRFTVISADPINLNKSTNPATSSRKR